MEPSIVGEGGICGRRKTAIKAMPPELNAYSASPLTTRAKMTTTQRRSRPCISFRALGGTGPFGSIVGPDNSVVVLTMHICGFHMVSEFQARTLSVEYPQLRLCQFLSVKQLDT